MKETIYLFDGSAYIFRAFFATPKLTNTQGMPTNALYGFTRMCLKFLREVTPSHVLMVFDAGEKTFRSELYAEYKANREECPPDLKIQMPYFRSLSRAMGFPVVELPGYEADDIIGTLTSALRELSHNVVIVSADKDLMQLVNDKVTMWDTMREKRYDPAGVFEKLQVKPEQVIDYLAIAGDSSDNIPGLRGAGPKTAVQLVERYGSVEEILNSIPQIREDTSLRNRKKIADTLESAAEDLRLSKQLVTICTDAPIDLSSIAPLHEKGAVAPDPALEHITGIHTVDELFESLKFRGPDDRALQALAQELNFESLIKEGFSEKASKVSSNERFSNYKLILKDEFQTWLKEFETQECFSFDLETTSLDVHTAELVGFACCYDDLVSYYIPCGHHEESNKQLSPEELLQAIGPRLRNPAVKKVGQNLKYDCEVLLTLGVEVAGVWFDTMVGAYLLHPDTGGYGLTRLAKEYLGISVIEYGSVVPAGGTFRDVPLARAVKYAAEDAHVAWLLFKKLERNIHEEKLQQVCFEVESPLVEVLTRIEHRGIRLDTEYLKKMSEEVGERLRILEQEIYKAAGTTFNINSPKQLGEVLFGKLGISTQGVKKLKTGYSTDHSVLEVIQERHPVPALILEYRALFKLQSTYIDSLPREVSPITGRLHTKLNQTIAATGRLSSSEPNLQNIPIQTELGRKVRNAFIPAEGCLFIGADYSQVELRLLAHLSGDSALIETFRHGVDIHERTAREVLGIGPLFPVSAEQRRFGKTMNFGIVYGMSGFRLARELGISVHEGNDYIERYFARYPKVREYFKTLEREVEEKGEVRTLLGRRRLVREIEVGSRDKNFIRRAALNAPLQGSAADLIKLAMLRLDRVIREEGLPLRMVLQVHDELLFEFEMNNVKSMSVETLAERVRREMEGIITLQVPLAVDVSTGKHWGEL